MRFRLYTGLDLTRVGRYQIEEAIGHGAMGVVYRATDPTIGRTVAIKAIRLSDFQDPDERTRIHKRLWQEARAAGALSHPNIVTVFDLVEQDSAAYIVMEYVSGESLAELFRRGETPERRDLLRYFQQMAEALDYAHQKGVIHRDVKPGNMIVSSTKVNGVSVAKMADFGVAKFISQNTTHSGTMIGTPSYISPEQIEGLRTDGRSDQFSLAVAMYELLTGQKPFDSDNLSALFYQICKQTPRPAEQVNPQLSARAGKALARGLAKEPDRRFFTCSELVADLTAGFPADLPVLVAAPVIAPTAEKVIAVPAAAYTLPPLPVRNAAPEEPDSRRKRALLSRVAALSGAGCLLLVGLVALIHDRVARPEPSAGPPTVVPDLPAVRDSPGAKKKAATTTSDAPPSPAPVSSAVSVLSLTTDPEGATAVVDEREESTCQTPCELRLPVGRHTVSATAPGFNVARRIVWLPGESDLRIKLDQSMGVLLLTSTPSGSDVSVDGKAAGQTPVTLRLTTGTHQLLLARGEQRHEESVVIDTDQFVSRNLDWHLP